MRPLRHDPVVHDPAVPDAAAAGRLAALGLTAADFEFVLAGAEAEARTWTALAPPVIAGMARWGKTNELLRVRLLPRGWTHDDPRNMPRTISPAGDFAIVAATGDGATGRPDATARNLYARGIETVRAIGSRSQLAFDFGLDLGRAGDLAIWLLLYHPAGDEIRAELSRPEDITPAGYVTGWAERIMLPPVPLAQPVTLRPAGPLPATALSDATTLADATALAGATVPVVRREA